MTSDLDEGKKNIEIESTTIVETEEYAQEETSYSEWEEENISIEDLGQASRNVSENIQIETDSTIVEIETETGLEMETESELETETQKETEMPSSSESESSSESSEEDKSDDEKEHEHHFKTISKKYVNGKDGKYHYETIKKSCECGEVKVIKKKEEHQLTDFASIGKDGEEQHCEKCEYKDVIDHDVTTYSIFTDNGNGTHKEEEIEKCNRDYCDYEGVVSTKVGPHDCGEFVNAGDNEKSYCQGEGCGFVQTRSHKEKTDVTYSSTGSHKHAAHTKTTCENGCGYETFSTKLEDCIHEEFTSNGVDYEVSVCPKCEDELERNHSYGEATPEYIAQNDGTHIEKLVYECSTCGQEKTEETQKDCTGTWVSKGAIGESKYCSECKTTDTRDHNLDKDTTVKYTGNGVDKHQHTKETDWVCLNEGCGYETHASKIEDCSMNYVDNETNEKAKCPTCENEVTKNHDMKEETRHIDNGDGKTHTVAAFNVCQNDYCKHEDEISKKSENHTASGSWINNGEAGEKNTCALEDCNGEMQRDHNMKEETRHIDNGDGKTHTVAVFNVCQNDNCGYEEKVSEKNENHTASGSWINNDKAGEKNTCAVEGCNGEMQRDHDLSGAPIGTGEYHYIGNKQHVEGAKKVCGNNCGYETVMPQDEAEPENCDLTGERKPEPNGEDITVTCPKCEHPEIVHTHNIVSNREKKSTYDPTNHNVLQTCDALYDDGTSCSYSNGPIEEAHNLVATGVENTDENPGMREMHCETNENGVGCGEFVWVEMTNTYSEEKIEEKTETETVEQTSEEVSEERETTTVADTEEMTQTTSDVVEEEQESTIDSTESNEAEEIEETETAIVNKEEEIVETTPEVIEEEQESIVDNENQTQEASEEVIEEATKQIIEEVAQELFAKGIDKQMTLTSQKMLAKKPEIMYTIYNEYVKKKRRNYC